MRVQLFEYCDQPWLPRVLRDAETAYLASALELTKPFAPLAPKLVAAMRGSPRVVDLASGAGGPWKSLAEEVAKLGVRPEITFTDLYPTASSIATPVDARHVPAELTGLRTMFDGFHHLRPADARAVLADAVAAGQPIVIGEAMSRRIPILVSTILIPLFVLLLMPRARPSFAAIMLTYVVPVLPLIIAWDGFVSCLRTYTPRELEAIAEGLEAFRWEAGYAKGATYLVGMPR